MLARAPPPFFPKPNTVCGPKPGYAHWVGGVPQNVRKATDTRAQHQCSRDSAFVHTAQNQAYPQGRPMCKRTVRDERASALPATVHRNFNPVWHGRAGCGDSRCNEFRQVEQFGQGGRKQCGANPGPAVASSSHIVFAKQGAQLRRLVGLKQEVRYTKNPFIATLVPKVTLTGIQHSTARKLIVLRARTPAAAHFAYLLAGWADIFHLLPSRAQAHAPTAGVLLVAYIVLLGGLYFAAGPILSQLHPVFQWSGRHLLLSAALTVALVNVVVYVRGRRVLQRLVA